jgi:hypothetical protein
LLVPCQLVDGLLIVVVEILVDPSFEPLHELLLDPLLDIGHDQSLVLPDPVPDFSLLLYRDDFLLALQLHLPHLDQHLPQLGESLLALVDLERGPIYQILIDLL